MRFRVVDGAGRDLEPYDSRGGHIPTVAWRGREMLINAGGHLRRVESGERPILLLIGGQRKCFTP